MLTAVASCLPHFPTPSEEQAVIVHEIVHECRNVVVDAVPGSGKTTVVQMTADALSRVAPRAKMLVLTYSKRLVDETVSKIAERALTHAVTVRTIHAHLTRDYATPGTYVADDVAMERLLQADVDPRPHAAAAYANCEIVIVDEAQDLSPLYFRAICKIVKDLQEARRTHPSSACAPLRIMFLGNRRQSIYEFKDADARFITLTEQLGLERLACATEWTRCALSKSYRLTPPMARFINAMFEPELDNPSHGEIQCAGSAERRATAAWKEKPRFICTSYLNLHVHVQREIERFQKMGYTPEDIIIVLPSVRSAKREAPHIRVANSITDMGIPIYLQDNDDGDLSSEALRGKLTLCTYHQAKGLERKALIVLQFEASYAEFYNRGAPCPHDFTHAQFVALSRGRERMTLMGSSLPQRALHCKHFLNTCTVLDCVSPDNCNLDGREVRSLEDLLRMENAAKRKKNPPSPMRSVTKLLRFMLPETAGEALAMARYTVVTPFIANEQLSCCATTSTHSSFGNGGDDAGMHRDIDMVEEVAEITGTAVVQDFRYRYKRLNKNEIMYFDSKTAASADTADAAMPLRALSTECLLEGCTRYCASVSGLKFKTKQIGDYTWLHSKDPCMRDKACARLRNLLCGTQIHTSNALGSYEFETPMRSLEHGITGVADAVCPHTDCVYEFKFVSGKLTDAHKLQLLIYMALYVLQSEDVYKNAGGMEKEKENKRRAKDRVCSKDSARSVRGVLYNVRTNECIHVEARRDHLQSALDTLCAPVPEKKRMDDADFVRTQRLTSSECLTALSRD